VFLLLWNGQLKAAFSHRRIREKPPSGGVSVYRESIPLDPELLTRSRALLDAFEWDGVAMIEYKVDERTGMPYLMEINGRFWGSLQLAVDAGVDFPALLAALALGLDPEPVTTYRVGVRSRWWWGDVDHLLARLRRSPEALALPPGSPGRWRALADFLTLHRTDRNEILRSDDPRPFLRETGQWVQGL
jgi:predicted ATP-grasp superfamily ATP-dependent carboligase